jgi:DNA-directed RNA polymerase subunit M/transcription elongation factor TFIIS
MEFCDLCENMLYIKIDMIENEKEQLKNYCKNCNFEKNLPNNKSIAIVENNYEREDINHEMFINPYIKYDPTLPRVNNIRCPNKDCTKKKNRTK